ncbi:hypothetical protein [Methylobacterium sp. V23]|uniref:hypothetical protein n=1 Tax=Methylobacterium sp. V23 TaxID=2044878 RepID=UPI000CDABB17|nr:hypothetical protein [Methylobacterium sp. V23]POR42576.1 hypothetical protein CRT23_12365 [Methylobacterium sp. V23]
MLSRISLALVALVGLSGAAASQALTLPEIGIQNSGTCRQLSVRNRANAAQVPMGCVDTGSNGFRSTPNALSLPSNADAASGGDVSPFSIKPPGGTFGRTHAQLAMDAGPSLLSFIPAGSTYAQFLADATSTFQSAANAMCAKSPAGGKIRLPALTMVLPAATSITWACPIVWEGQGWSEVPSGGGTWIHITGTVANPFKLTDPRARGTTFSNLGIYQDQPAPATPWTPTVYPYVFSVQGLAGMVRFDNIILAPVYDFVDADLSGRLETNNIFGQVLHNAYRLDRMYDKTHFTGKTHFWPVWSAAQGVMDWQVANADVLILRRVDGLEAPDTFVFGYRAGVRFEQSTTADPGGATGFASKVHFGNFYCDSCKWGVWNTKAGGTQPFQYAQGRFETFEFAGIVPNSPSNAPIAGSSSVQIDPAGGMDLSYGRLSSEVSAGSAINLANTSLPTRLRIGDFYARSYGGPAISMVQGANDDVSIATIPSIANGQLTSLTSAAFSAPLAMGSSVTMTAGGTFSMTSDRKGFVFTGAGTIASYTITLPATPYDGQEVFISPLVAVTALTVNAVSGQTVLNPPTSFVAGQPVSFVYVVGAGAWIRR